MRIRACPVPVGLSSSAVRRGGRLRRGAGGRVRVLAELEDAFSRCLNADRAPGAVTRHI